ncbi:MAG: anthranilate synthase component I [Phycisphaerae bacterium]|nr:MAG: anthranilate synthase component I [Phycisphaerae bacterium]
MPRYFPDENTFRTLASEAQVVPVYRQLLADHLTPVTAFEVLGRDANAFLLESVVGGEKIGRFSFIATNPAALYTALQGQASVVRWGRPSEQFSTNDPLADLSRLLPARKVARLPNIPSFTGGLVGYAGYDLIRYYESEKLNHAPVDDRGLPEVVFGLYHELVIFDHVDKTVKVVANAFVEGSDPKPAYLDACRRVDRLVQLLKQPPVSRLGEVDPQIPLTLNFSSNLTREQYESGVRKGIEYIRAGDIFQFVPSLRLRVSSQADPFDVYRALRVVNPSPYMFYLKTPGCILIGSSPEVLCSVQNGKVVTRPLAGTRRRGQTPEQDQALEAELLSDPKERAEHIMLVDLHRNDIGRVCQIGSVVVDECMVVERYSHVMHISSNVTGILRPDQTAFDALRVSLPVGTVSGAPKIRAMQIIDEVEPTRRGPYGGAVGYFDLAGNMDTCIALRTIVYRNGTFDVQAGAGVVADSIPANEYDECRNKAMALLKSVQIATTGF